MKKIFCLLFCLNVSVAFADCPMAQLYEKAGKDYFAWTHYKACADMEDDAPSQLYIGQIYLDGNDNVPQSLSMAFTYFRKAAENGYAPAQRQLAVFLSDLASLGEDGKQAVIEFEAQWQTSDDESITPMTALSWMMLAAERTENKWFYFSEAIQDEQAVKLLPQFKANATSEDLKQAQKAATAWKQRQLLRQAKVLLTQDAFEDFKRMIYPSKNTKIKLSRIQAVEELKRYKMSKRK